MNAVVGYPVLAFNKECAHRVPHLHCQSRPAVTELIVAVKQAKAWGSTLLPPAA